MGRFHALEWEDLSWFPSNWRDYGTDYLQFIAVKADIYKATLPIIKRGLQAAENHEWVDCASGGGAALTTLATRIRQEEGFADLTVKLTDFYPNKAAFERTRAYDPSLFSYESTAVDARHLPEHLKGKFRTLFGGFHHFRPDDAQKILQDAVDSRSPIAIFEPVGRNFGAWLSMLFVPINVLIITFFLRPVRWSVLPFIYLLPLVPLYILWDGIASILRIYSVKEMQNLVSKLNNSDSFVWDIGTTGSAFMPTHYLLGVPKREG